MSYTVKVPDRSSKFAAKMPSINILHDIYELSQTLIAVKNLDQLQFPYKKTYNSTYNSTITYAIFAHANLHVDEWYGSHTGGHVNYPCR